MTLAPVPEFAPLVAAVLDARAAVQTARQAGPASVGGRDLEQAIVELSELESQVTSLRLSLAAEADERGMAGAAAATGTDAWLARLTGETREVMAGGLWVARQLQQKYHHTREALADGRLRLTQAKVIVRAAERAPGSVPSDQVALAEESLVAMATGEGTVSGRPMAAARLRQEARRMFSILSAQLADQMEADQLAEEEKRAEAESWFMLDDNGDGTFSGKFVLPELHGRMLQGALERLTAPRRLTRLVGPEGVERSVEDESAPAQIGGATGWTRSEKFALAFCELIEHLPSQGYGAGNAATLVVHLDHQHLVDGLAAATLDSGIRVSAGQARRLACNASILPAVFGGDSVPLDLGRGQRLHSFHQRVALSAVHDTCAVESCERPFGWTEVHHPHWWSHGGPTNLDNALPLCGFHHRRAHDDVWDLREHSGGRWRFHRRT